MLDQIFLFWVVVFALMAIAFIGFLDLLFIVILWRWEVVKSAHRRRKRARLRASRRCERFDKILVPTNSQAATQVMQRLEHDRLYGAPW